VGGTILGGRRYTAQSDGRLFQTDLRNGSRQNVGHADFAAAHEGDPVVPANVTVRCACKVNEVTDNPLDIAIGEALYGRADFNNDGLSFEIPAVVVANHRPDG
jgi:hypothetical protein